MAFWSFINGIFMIKDESVLASIIGVVMKGSFRAQRAGQKARFKACSFQRRNAGRRHSGLCSGCYGKGDGGQGSYIIQRAGALDFLYPV